MRINETTAGVNWPLIEEKNPIVVVQMPDDFEVRYAIQDITLDRENDILIIHVA